MKRVLIIAYYWPPAGGPGVQRWLHFVRHFEAHGIAPVVYVPEAPNYPIVDESLVQKVPPSITVLRHPIKEPYQMARWLSKKKTKTLSSGIISEKKPSFLEKLLLFIRGNFFIPDARVGWVQPSVSYLKEYLSDSPVDAIVTTGPPHSLHLIGMQLKAAFDVPWLADFRDPWTTIHYHKSLRLTKASEAKHKRLEAKVLNTATAITVTSEVTKKEFQALTDRPIHVITNGFEIQPTDSTYERDERFSLVHIGSLLTERNPSVLWKVLRALQEADPVFKEQLEIKLVGHYSAEVLEDLEHFGLSQNTTLVGYVPHEEAVALQRQAQVLLLVEMNREETRAIIPGKLFEYLSARRPILALGPKGTDVEQIIQRTKAGTYITYAEETELIQTIETYFHQFLQQELNIPKTDISEYSREAIAKKMAQLLHDL
ncbi:glycosyltransferase family 4 protein [Altibacter sp. HG106]|uniref:glycosyltransferase family 4 protein n=1 Tax=Altibacter sp. HG106 TaxID=3023937 RepID=UPI0023502356|nr:glycosyltransferase family 4 protein [Altibacter sp. HG106]MDC7993671.1 glycosyltransferase family 4 protein [Altibacter sp. HG106]